MYVRDAVLDDSKALMRCLRELTDAPDMTFSGFVHTFFLRQRSNIRTFVCVDKSKIIGTASLMVEHKFIRGGRKVGHIEDVSVLKSEQGRGVGKQLIEHCVDVAKRYQCYKIILDCSNDNVPFYEKCGFKKHENCMRLDLTENTV